MAALALRATDLAACENSVRAESPPIDALQRAERALDLGDLSFARAKAEEAAALTPQLRLAADAIESVATARDPAATEDELLAARRAMHPRGTLETDPKGNVRLAEIEARIPKYRDHAHEILASLQKRDLVGDAWAIAALARLEPESQRPALFAECNVRAANPSAACRAELGPPPFFALRGDPGSYELAMAIFVASLLAALVRSLTKRPWRGYLMRWQIGVAVVGLLAVLLTPSRQYLSTWSVVVLMATACFVSFVVESRLFLRAVKRGKVKGLVLREPDEDDENLKRLPVNGLRESAVLDRVAKEEGYRTSARMGALCRVVPAPTLDAGRVAGFALLFALFAFATLGSTRKADDPDNWAPMSKVSPPPLSATEPSHL